MEDDINYPSCKDCKHCTVTSLFKRELGCELFINIHTFKPRLCSDVRKPTEICGVKGIFFTERSNLWSKLTKMFK